MSNIHMLDERTFEVTEDALPLNKLPSIYTSQYSSAEVLLKMKKYTTLWENIYECHSVAMDGLVMRQRTTYYDNTNPAKQEETLLRLRSASNGVTNKAIYSIKNLPEGLCRCYMSFEHSDYPGKMYEQCVTGYMSSDLLGTILKPHFDPANGFFDILKSKEFYLRLEYAMI